MFCPNCGKQLEDRVKFCTNCGTSLVTPANATPAAPVNSAPAPVIASKPNKKKRNPLLVVLPIAAVVLLVIISLVIGLLTGIIGNDKTKLASALTKSALAYKEASEEIPLPALAEKGEKVAFSQSVDVKIDELPAMPSLEGFGLQLALDSNLPGREVAMTVSPSFGSAKILDAQVLLRDNEFFLALPQLLGERSYVVNTEKIGASLVNREIVEADMESFGFNLFDIMDILEDSSKIDEDMKKELEKAFKAFVKTIEVDKTGKEKTDVNDHNLKCDVYQVIITEESLRELLDVAEELCRRSDPMDVGAAVLESLGLPDNVINEALAEMDTVDSTREVFATLEDAITELGDIELEVFLHKGYVVAAKYEASIDGTNLEVTLNMGGGDNYVDELRLEFLADGGKIVVASNGNHAGAKGVYTDTTTVKIYSDYSDTITFTSELYYEPAGESENFSWNLDADVLKVDVVGQITADKKTVSVQLDEMNIWVDGVYIIGIGLDVQVGEYMPASVNTANAIALLDLTEAELASELEYIGMAASDWALGLVESNPELLGMLQGMMF